MDQDRGKRVVVSRDLINSFSYKAQFGVGDNAVVPGQVHVPSVDLLEIIL